MTKTEAAKTMALDVRVFARRAGVPVTKHLVEERISEWRGATYVGTYKAEAAKLANVTTTLRQALAWEL